MNSLSRVLAGAMLSCVVAACSPRAPDPAPEEATSLADAGGDPGVAGPSGDASPANAPADGTATSGIDVRPIPARLRATGTEPFWGAAIDGPGLVYTTPEFPAGMRVTVIRRDGPGRAIFTGTLDGKPLTLTIERGPCSDGMSDTIYPMTARREIGPDIERGCAKGGA